MSKILIDEAALEQALEMLNDNREYIEANERPAYLAIYDKAIADAEKALAEAEKQQALDKMADNARELGLSYEQPAPAQEPDTDELTIAYMSGLHEGKKRKPWVGLTDEEVQATVYDANGGVLTYRDRVRAIEAKLKEKNT